MDNNSNTQSSGIGTGAAQIFSTDKTYAAFQDSLQASKDALAYQQRVKAIKAKEEAEAKKDKIAINQKFDKDHSVDYTNLFVGDIEGVRKDVENYFIDFGDKGDKIHNGGEEYLESNRRWEEIKSKVAISLQTKVAYNDKGKDINENPEKYSNEKREQYNSFQGKEGLTPDIFQKINRDLKIKSSVDVASDKNKDVTKYFKPKTSYINDAGVSTDNSLTLLSKEDQLNEYKKSFSTDVDFLSGLSSEIAEIKKENKDISDEDASNTAWNQSYAAWASKNLPQESIDKKYTTTKPDKPDKPDKPIFEYKTIYRQELGHNVLFLSKKNGEQISFDYGGFVKDGKDYALKKPIIEYVWVDENGKIKSKVSGEDADGGLVSGQTVELPLSYWAQIAMGLGLQGTIREIQDATKPTSAAVSNKSSGKKLKNNSSTKGTVDENL